MMGRNPNRTPSEHPNPHQNRRKWVVHLPQNGTIRFDPQPTTLTRTPFLSRRRLTSETDHFLHRSTAPRADGFAAWLRPLRMRRSTSMAWPVLGFFLGFTFGFHVEYVSIEAWHAFWGFFIEGKPQYCTFSAFPAAEITQAKDPHGFIRNMQLPRNFGGSPLNIGYWNMEPAAPALLPKELPISGSFCYLKDPETEAQP